MDAHINSRRVTIKSNTFFLYFQHQIYFADFWCDQNLVKAKLSKRLKNCKYECITHYIEKCC